MNLPVCLRRFVVGAVPPVALALGCVAPTPAQAQPAACNLQQVQQALDKRLIPPLEGCRFGAVAGLLKKRDLTVRASSGIAPGPEDVILSQRPPAGSPVGGNPVLTVGVEGSITPPPPPSKAAPVLQTRLLSTFAPSRAVGQPLLYRLAIDNVGAATAHDVTVNAQSSNLSVGPVDGTQCQALPCQIGDILPGASERINVSGRALEAGSFVLTVQAGTARTKPTVDDRVVITGVATALAAPARTADLSLSLSPAWRQSLTLHQPVSYRLVIVNNGPADATDVRLTVRMRNLVVSHLAAISGVSGACASLDSCVIGDLANGARAVIDVTGSADAVGTAVAQMQVTASPSDPDRANNSKEFSADVKGRPGLWQRGLLIASQAAGQLRAAAVVAAVLLIALGGAVAIRARRWRARQRWLALIQVSAVLDPDVTWAASAISPTLPPLRIDVHIEPGDSRIASPLPARPHAELT